MRLQTLSVMALGLTVLFVGACRKDKSNGDDDAKPKPVDVEAYKRKQAAFADSVLQSVPNAKKVAEKLGQKYEVGSVTLRDTVALLARDPKHGCFERGKKFDPYLAGTVSFWINMSVVGSDVIRVEESTWTSRAGGLVDECLLEASKSWKFSAAFGAPNAYIVQVQFR
ncbi:MAG: hypothetical protein NTZ43_02555 [Gemmatimonadetes bacterium]|nr:hypothetical protein [Gemmatimonadota bacterium]